MANIETEIAAIRDAVLGEEVRQSIIDALQKMNAQLSSLEDRVEDLEFPE